MTDSWFRAPTLDPKNVPHPSERPGGRPSPEISEREILSFCSPLPRYPPPCPSPRHVKTCLASKTASSRYYGTYEIPINREIRRRAADAGARGAAGQRSSGKVLAFAGPVPGGRSINIVAARERTRPSGDKRRLCRRGDRWIIRRRRKVFVKQCILLYVSSSRVPSPMSHLLTAVAPQLLYTGVVR